MPRANFPFTATNRKWKNAISALNMPANIREHCSSTLKSGLNDAQKMCNNIYEHCNKR